MKAKEYQKHLEAIMKNPASYGIRECIICGREHIVIVGIWLPSNEAAKHLNAPEGKYRTVFYGLCEECASKGKESADKIEGIVLGDVNDGKQPINLIS